MIMLNCLQLLIDVHVLRFLYLEIMKDDRLILRQMIKENNNEIITLVTTYKKKNGIFSP